MTTQFNKVKAFQQAFCSNVGTVPCLPSETERALRLNLLKEEFDELIEAEGARLVYTDDAEKWTFPYEPNLVEIADAIGDMMYILNGTAVSYGIPIDEIFNEIHASNMSKLDENGEPIFREDGKVLKGANYFKPNLEKIMRDHGMQ